MIHAYNKLYLSDAQDNLSLMLDIAVNSWDFELKEFYHLFLMSVYAGRFGKGDYEILAGRSGEELAINVLEFHNIPIPEKEIVYTFEKSPEYWTGWALAYYQWNSGMTFEKINNIIDIDSIHNMYRPYHEMDITQFSDRLDQIRKGHSFN